MSKFNDGLSPAAGARAERALAAFLRAASDVAGESNTRRAGDAWLHAMESLECPEGNHEKFLRRVTILAISELLADSGAAAHGGTKKPEREVNLPSISRTAA